MATCTHHSAGLCDANHALFRITSVQQYLQLPRGSSAFRSDRIACRDSTDQSDPYLRQLRRFAAACLSYHNHDIILLNSFEDVGSVLSDG
jgi:hypothetical protein